MDLSTNEKRILRKLIEDAANTMSNQGCDDLEVENTAENWALLVEMEEDNVGKPFYEIPSSERTYPARPEAATTPHLCLTNWAALRYLGRKATRP